MRLAHKLRKFALYKIFKPLGYHPLDYRQRVKKALQHALLQNDLNICYNNQVRKQYKAGKKNILLAIESPEVIAHEGWIDPEMHFYAEISFHKISNAPHFFCCRDLYATLDSFVDMPGAEQLLPKTKGVSFVFSHQKHLSGHRFRHQLAGVLPKWVALYGSGTGSFLENKEDSIRPYAFQLVVENGKYPEYVSEKFFDCIKLKTIPIYRGGTLGLQKMGFDPEGYLTFDTPEELLIILQNFDWQNQYQQRLGAVNYNLQRLREIRNEAKFSLYLSPVMLAYMGRQGSNLGIGKPKLKLELD